MRSEIRVLALACGLLLGGAVAVAGPQDTHAGTPPALTSSGVTAAPTTFTFAGKLVTVPAGSEYRLDEKGSLVISLTSQSEREIAVVKIGETFVVISRDEPLVIDPRGRPRGSRRFAFVLPGLNQLHASSLSSGPDASPIRP